MVSWQEQGLLSFSNKRDVSVKSQKKNKNKGDKGLDILLITPGMCLYGIILHLLWNSV